MKFKFKKYIYFLNDLTNIILKKEKKEAEESVKKLRMVLIIVSIVLFFSLVINILVYLK